MRTQKHKHRRQAAACRYPNYHSMRGLDASRRKRLTFVARVFLFCTAAEIGNDAKTGDWRGNGRGDMLKTALTTRGGSCRAGESASVDKRRGNVRMRGGRWLWGVAAAAILASCAERVELPAQPTTAANVEAERFKYDPPIELSTVGTRSTTLVYPPGDNMNDNEWTRHLRDNLGIRVTKWWEAPGDLLEQKTNLMIATGDIPDFFIATPTQLVQLVKADLIEPLTDIYSRYASEAVRTMIEQAGPEVLEAARFDGKLMAIPFTGVAKESVPVLWVREDWRAKLQLPQPKTMDDLLAIAKAFTERDPDGNGERDTFGLGLNQSLSMALGFFNGFHAYKGIWVRAADGSLVNGSIQPEMRQALSRLRDMYEAGQLNPDFAIQESGKVYQMIGEDKIGMVFGSITAYSLAQQTPNSRWLAYPAPSTDERPAMLQHGLNIFGGFWVVRKGVEHPEALLRMAYEFVDKFYTNTDDNVYKQFNYDIDSKTSIWLQAPVKLYKAYKNAEISAHLEPFLRTGREPTEGEWDALTPEEREKYRQIADYLSGSSADWSVAGRNGPSGGGAVIIDYVRNGQMLPDAFYGPPTRTMVQRLSQLARLEEDMMTRIIMGAPLAEFDRFVEDWMRLGGAQMTREVNEWARTK